MLRKKNTKLTVKLFLFFLIGCGLNNNSQTENELCKCINSDNLLGCSYWEDEKAYDSLLNTVISCDQTARIIRARLNLLTFMDRSRQALDYLKTVNNSDFERPYEKLSYENYFKSQITTDSLKRKMLTKKTLYHISKYLKKYPLDTVSLGPYVAYSLELYSKEQVFKKIDSMADHNGYHPVYEFTLSLHLPSFVTKYRKKVCKSGSSKEI